MAKQDLLDKIIAEANEKASSLRAEAKARADALISAAEEESAALSESARKLASSSAPEVLKRRRSMAELEVRKILLEGKQELISKSYQEALDRVVASPKYQDLLLSMICSSAEEGDSVQFALSDEGKINETKILSAASKKLGFALSAAKEKGDFRGGIVLLGKHYDKNLTLESELARLRAEKGGVDKVLFS